MSRSTFLALTKIAVSPRWFRIGRVRGGFVATHCGCVIAKKRGYGDLLHMATYLYGDRCCTHPAALTPLP